MPPGFSVHSRKVKHQTDCKTFANAKYPVAFAANSSSFVLVKNIDLTAKTNSLAENKPPDGKSVPGRSEQRPIFRRSSNSILFSRKSVVLLFIIDISIGILLVFLLLFFLELLSSLSPFGRLSSRNGHAQNVERVGSIHHSPNR